MTPTIPNRPVGAIRSIEQIEMIIADAAQEGEITLYYVHGLGRASCVSTYIIDGTSYVENTFLHLSNKDVFSLGDCNVNHFNQYNDHFLFENKKLAEAYLAHCKSSAVQEAETQSHWRHCNHIFGRWGSL